jgi:hypothetical protein
MLRQVSPISAYHPTCSLFSIAGVNLTGADVRQAEREFGQQRGYPYAMLYRETHAGAPHYDRCVRLVQQAENQFAYYDYSHPGTKPRFLTNAAWGQSLAHVGQGHFIGVCTNTASEPVQGVLLVKYDTTVVFSLVLSLHEQAYFTGLDKLRVEAARALVQRTVYEKR